ncbi:hypothetical protein SynA1544_02149 [Synechococcus sp. A15-44]|nr:hypothetical protein SynA1544_02149 [Synechococcus sp. A15-44]
MAPNAAMVLLLIYSFRERRSQLPRVWLALPKQGSSPGLDTKESKDCF